MSVTARTQTSHQHGPRSLCIAATCLPSRHAPRRHAGTASRLPAHLLQLCGSNGAVGVGVELGEGGHASLALALHDVLPHGRRGAARPHVVVHPVGAASIGADGAAVDLWKRMRGQGALGSDGGEAGDSVKGDTEEERRRTDGNAGTGEGLRHRPTVLRQQGKLTTNPRVRRAHSYRMRDVAAL